MRYIKLSGLFLLAIALFIGGYYLANVSVMMIGVVIMFAVFVNQILRLIETWRIQQYYQRELRLRNEYWLNRMGRN